MSGTATTPTAELRFLGSRARILQGDERLGLVDMLEVPAGECSPLHVHHVHDEGFYVVDGEMTLFVPGRSVTLRPGDFFLAPHGVPHAYEVGARPAHWLVTSTPAGFERFVAEVAGAGAVDPAALGEIATRHEIEVLGPPGARP